MSGPPTAGARPTGSLGQRARAWLRRHRKGAWAVVGVVVVLGAGAGLLQSPAGQDWRLARKACEGKLPGDDLETLRTAGHLEDEETFSAPQVGQYGCLLRNDEGKVVVSVQAFTRARDQRRVLGRLGEEAPPYRLLPGALPGYAGDDGEIHLMPECPKLGKDTAGDPQRMLVTTWVPFLESRAERAALLRTAVTLTNHASERLGCDDRQLAAPRDGAVPHDGAQVRLAEVSRTPCAALSRVPLGEGAEGAKVRVRVSERTPVARCSLSVSGADGRRPVLDLVAWYGNWGADSDAQGVGQDRRGRDADGDPTPVWDASRAWATARCGGEAASFDAHWHSGGTADGRAERRVLPRTDEEKGTVLRETVSRFARDEARRRGCDGLDLPGADDRLPE